MVSSSSRAISAGVRLTQGMTTPARVTSHGRKPTRTRLLPSQSGYGDVTRPNSESPRPWLSGLSVTSVCPPIAAMVLFAGVFCSEYLAASMNISEPPSWVPDSDISDDETKPAYLPAGSMSRGCRKLLPGLCAPYSTNMSVPSGLVRKIAKRLRGPTCSQRENMMSPFGRTTGLRS